MFPTGSICFPLNSDAFLACSRSLETALFFEFWSNSLLKVCAELLELSITEYQDALYGALNQLSLLSAFEVPCLPG